MSRTLLSLSLLLLTSLRAHGQSSPPPAVVETSDFNSSFRVTPAQLALGKFPASEAASLDNIINFERSQYAGGSTDEDAFYNLPTTLPNGQPLDPENPPPPGTLLKTEDFTAIQNYSLPSNLALSRLLYVSANLNGTAVPASAFILWPFSPKHFSTTNPSQAPVVVWTHPTSGFLHPAAPSKHRTLWAGYNGPFPLALEGYAVLAPDYAGLGAPPFAPDRPAPHQYLASPASANDALHALQAATTAFSSRLTPAWAAIGQSQGGGVAWAIAEAVALRAQSFAPAVVSGYRGAVAVSPTTQAFAGTQNYIVSYVSLSLASVFPSFKPADLLTPLGVARDTLFRQLQGGLAVGDELFTTTDVLPRDDWKESWYVSAYERLTDAGGKKFAGPLLVIQGTEDPVIAYNLTADAVARTCAADPEGALEFLTVNGTGHVPTLDASRSLWLGWLAERFEGKPVHENGCVNSTLESFLPIQRYQATGNSYTQWAGAEDLSYLVPLAL